MSKIHAITHLWIWIQNWIWILHLDNDENQDNNDNTNSEQHSESVNKKTVILTDLVLNTFSNFKVIMIEQRSEDVIDLKKQYWQFTMMNKINKKIRDWKHTVASLQTNWENNHWINALFIAWQQEMKNISKEKIDFIYTSLNANIIQKFDKQQKYLNNWLYQWNNVDAAYKILRLIEKLKSYFSNMHQSRWFKSWQSVIILCMCEICSISQSMNECILADVVELKKI